MRWSTSRQAQVAALEVAKFATGPLGPRETVEVDHGIKVLKHHFFLSIKSADILIRRLAHAVPACINLHEVVLQRELAVI
jgi:hypothetical protein